MEKLDHIGIAVKNLEESNILFAKLLGKEHYKIEEVASEGVRTSFFALGNVKIELLEAAGEDSAIARFIEKRGEGLHHLAFEVKDIDESIREYTEQDFKLTQPVPFRGADNKKVCFIHPKSTNGVLVELCQSIPPAEESAKTAS